MTIQLWGYPHGYGTPQLSNCGSGFINMFLARVHQCCHRLNVKDAAQELHRKDIHQPRAVSWEMNNDSTNNNHN